MDEKENIENHLTVVVVARAPGTDDGALLVGRTTFTQPPTIVGVGITREATSINEQGVPILMSIRKINFVLPFHRN